MSGVYNEIQAALDGHLNTFATAESLPVAWENIRYMPTTGSAWIRPNLMPSECHQASLGIDGLNYLTGVYHVSLFYPAWAGSGTARDKADDLVSHFKRGTTVTSGGVTVEVLKVWRHQALQEPDWYHIPVSVIWFAYAENV